MVKANVRDISLEIASAAHGRAVHALWPMITACNREQRDTVYQLLAREFSALADTLELLLLERLKNGSLTPSTGSKST